MSWRNEGGQRDDGGADPGVAAVLAAYAAGQGSEQAALTALAGSRLLVPVVAVPAGQAAGGAGRGGEAVTEIAMPTLIGNDGRPAVLAFTCLDSLARWRKDARPVPVPAARAWQAGAEQAGAVVVDVAGPVPVAVDGARLAALAAGDPVPPPHQDPDVLAAARGVTAGEQCISGFSLEPGREGSDLALRLNLAAGCDAASPAVRDATARAATGLIAAAGSRLRRGVEVMLTTAGAGEQPCAG